MILLDTNAVFAAMEEKLEKNWGQSGISLPFESPAAGRSFSRRCTDGPAAPGSVISRGAGAPAQPAAFLYLANALRRAAFGAGGLISAS
jgi:hypothetical protein